MFVPFCETATTPVDRAGIKERGWPQLSYREIMEDRSVRVQFGLGCLRQSTKSMLLTTDCNAGEDGEYNGENVLMSRQVCKLRSR